VSDSQTIITLEQVPPKIDHPLLQECLQIRQIVFVQEQHCDPSSDLDSVDTHCQTLHILVRVNGQLAATGRCFPATSMPCGGCWRIGRMAVLKEFRGLGLGSRILEWFHQRLVESEVAQTVLDAQCHALEFYRRFGYVAEGDIFLDENIPHQLMKKTL
jgi:predicted GNAT family N-acyltransferase